MVEVPKMKWCSKCVYPHVAATPLTFDEEGACSGCRVDVEQQKVNWDRRKKMFEDLLMDMKLGCGNSRYDCLIPVSGGKDSFYQCHIIRNVYKLNPLLVTYGENNYTDVGMRNIKRMRDVFNADHIFFQPSVEVLKKLNRIGLRKMGDPDMHAHIGIFTYPMQVAVRYNIPLIVWGEHGFMHLGGMHSYNDLVEFTAKYRKEHNLRGYDWQDFVGEEGLTEKDLQWAQYPNDEEIERMGLRGIYLANYFGWKPRHQMELMRSLYGFELSEKPFDRTYRRDTALNNMHDHGLHDYMKFVKWGYGRATDYASLDIREGYFDRPKGIEMVQQYDDVIPGDIPRWLEYVGMTRTELYEIADRFRDVHVWSRDGHGHWVKDNIWYYKWIQADNGYWYRAEELADLKKKLQKI